MLTTVSDLAYAKRKRCKVCKDLFSPLNTFQAVCSPSCAMEYTKQDKGRAHVQKMVRRETRAWKKRNKTKREWTKEAQKAFNAWIRLRDKELPCMSCDRTNEEVAGDGIGGDWDCGHYLSVGSHPELRFEEDNAAKQCKRCNGGSGRYAKKNHTVQQSYRVNLIKRIGLERVEWLEGPHEMPKRTIDDLISIKRDYTQRVRAATHEK